MRRNRYVSVLHWLLLPSFAAAQNQSGSTTQPTIEEPAPLAFFIWPEPAKLVGPIQTDRPGFSDSASLVPRGHVQLELGYIYAYDQEHHTETQTNLIPGTSLRVGLFDAFELRVKWSGMSLVESKYRDVSPGGRTYTNHQHDDGATDMSVGFKAPILKHDETNHLPNVSMIPSLSLPTGTDSKSSGDVDPTFEVAWNYPLTEKLLVYGVGSIASISDSDGRFAQATSSLATSYTVTDRLSLFVEYFGIYPAARGADCQYNIDGGPVYLITDNLQLDFAVGMGLNEEAPDFFMNMGVSIRF